MNFALFLNRDNVYLIVFATKDLNNILNINKRHSNYWKNLVQVIITIFLSVNLNLLCPHLIFLTMYIDTTKEDLDLPKTLIN